METTAHARILQRKEKHPDPVAVQSFSVGGDGNNDYQQRGGDNNDGKIEESKDCIPFDDPRAVESAEITEGSCQHNLCDGGCCRYHTQFLTCDKKNDFSHQECICNNLTDNTHLENSGSVGEGFNNDLPTDPPTNPPTDSPTDSPTVTPCAEGELDFSFIITTDDHADETSWELVNSQGQSVVAFGEDYTSGTTYNIRQCIPDECYTLTIYDSYGDGMCCGSKKTPGYRLTVDGTILNAENGIVNFGFETGFDFGSCEDIVFNVDPPDLIPAVPGPVETVPVETSCALDLELTCEQLVSLAVTTSCELTVSGLGEDDVELTQLNFFSNVFGFTDMTEAVDEVTLSEGQTQAVPFTITFDQTNIGGPRYTFFAVVIGETENGEEECYADFLYEFSV
jgi:hypothetical protein